MTIHRQVKSESEDSAVGRPWAKGEKEKIAWYGEKEGDDGGRGEKTCRSSAEL